MALWQEESVRTRFAPAGLARKRLTGFFQKAEKCDKCRTLRVIMGISGE